MAWGLPDKGEGASNIQSILFQEYLDVLVAGINGIDCVLVGCIVTAQGSPDMTVAVSKGAILSNGLLFPVTAGNATITTAHATLPRLDLVVATSAGAKAVRAGTAAANPAPPARTANDVVLAVVYVPAADTTISTNQIVDLRMVRTQGPILIYKTTVAETTNNTTAGIELLNKANAGLTVPNGLLLAGRILRVRIGGNMLLNSGTPTIRFVINYAGTLLFDDISAAATADADRLAWFLDFQITAQGNADQALSGLITMGQIAAKTASAAGIGDIFSTATNVNAVSGASAIDSDAADRLLKAQIVLNVANAANEVVTEFASVELI